MDDTIGETSKHTKIIAVKNVPNVKYLTKKKSKKAAIRFTEAQASGE